MNSDDLVALSRARFDYQTQKKLLREKYEAKMLFAYNGGMFRAGPELLGLLQAIPVTDDVVILDLYQNPIKITPQEIQFLAVDRWQEQMNAWHVEYEEMSKKR
jgi:uncharacterized protein YigE (DUF2233 family)